MNPLMTASTLILGSITFLSISSPSAVGCNVYTETKAEVEFLTDDKKCIDVKEKELLYKVEA